MQYLISHWPALLAILLLFSELAAAISQLIYPTNNGLNGAIAAFIKILQGVKDNQAPKGQ